MNRIELPPNIFLLNPHMQEYLSGEKPLHQIPGAVEFAVGKLPAPLMALFFGVSGLLVSGAGIFLMNQLFYQIILALSGLILLGMIPLVFSRRKEGRLLAQNSQVLTGEIVETETESLGHQAGNYFLTVKFRFTAPSGRVLDGSGGVARNTKNRPQAGNPVAILYVNEQLFRLL